MTTCMECVRAIMAEGSYEPQDGRKAVGGVHQSDGLHGASALFRNARLSPAALMIAIDGPSTRTKLVRCHSRKHLLTLSRAAPTSATIASRSPVTRPRNREQFASNRRASF